MSTIAQIQWNNWVNLNSDFTSELKGKSWRKESGLSFVPSQSKFSRRRWWEISLTPFLDRSLGKLCPSSVLLELHCRQALDLVLVAGLPLHGLLLAHLKWLEVVGHNSEMSYIVSLTLISSPTSVPPPALESSSPQSLLSPRPSPSHPRPRDESFYY